MTANPTMIARLSFFRFRNTHDGGSYFFAATSALEAAEALAAGRVPPAKASAGAAGRGADPNAPLRKLAGLTDCS